MGAPKPIIFINPLSDSLLKLKETLEEENLGGGDTEESEEEDFYGKSKKPKEKPSNDEGEEDKESDVAKKYDIYELDDLAEAMQLVPVVGASLVATSSPKKCAVLLKTHEKLIKKLRTKVILLSMSQIPRKVLKKLDKYGLTECIFEPVAPKTLIYKTNLLIKALPVTKTEEEEEGPAKVISSEEVDYKIENQEKQRVERGLTSDSDSTKELTSKTTAETTFDFADDEVQSKGSTLGELDIQEDESKKKDALSLDIEDDTPVGARELSNSLLNDLDVEMEKKALRGLDIEDDSSSGGKSPLGDLQFEDEKTTKSKSINLELEEEKSSQELPRPDHFSPDDNEKKRKDLNLQLEEEEEGLSPLGNAVEAELDNLARDLEKSALDIVDEENNGLAKDLSGLELEDDSTKGKNKVHLDLESEEEKGKAHKAQLDLEKEKKAKQDKQRLELEAEKRAMEKAMLELEQEETPDALANELEEALLDAEEKAKKTQLDLEEDPLAKEMDRLSLDVEKDKDKEKDQTLELAEELGDYWENEELDEEDMGNLKDEFKKLNLNLEDEGSEQEDAQLQLEEEKETELDLDDDDLADEALSDNERRAMELEIQQESTREDQKLDLDIESELDNQLKAKADDPDELQKKSLDQLANLDIEAEDKVHLKEEKKYDWDIEKNREQDQEYWKKEKKDQGNIDYSEFSKERKEGAIDYNQLKKSFEGVDVDMSTKDKEKKSGQRVQDGQGPKTYDRADYGDEELEDVDATAEEEMEEESELIFEPDSKGFEYIIEALSLYISNKKDDREIQDKILNYTANTVYDRFKGEATFFIKDVNSGTFSEHLNYKLSKMKEGRDEYEEEWREIKSDQLPRWSEALLPTWSDKTFQKRNQEFIYPYREGDNPMGFAVVNFENGIQEKDAIHAEIVLESARGVYLSNFHQQGGETTYSGKEKKEEKEKVKKKSKVKSFFSGLFGKKAS